MLGFFFFLGGRLSNSLGDFQPVLVTVGCESARQGCSLSLCAIRKLPTLQESSSPPRLWAPWAARPQLVMSSKKESWDSNISCPIK